MSVFAYPSTVIREAEVPLLEAGVPLMARAANALARFALDELQTTVGRVYGTRVCVLAGPGNNAGDALFAAAELARRGVAVTVITLFERTHAEGLAAARRAGAQGIAHTGVATDRTGEANEEAGDEALRELNRSDLVLDGILGTGGRKGLPEHISDLIAAWSPGRNTPQDRTTVIAVDVPSDLSPEATGAEDRIHADATVTFGGLKAELIDPRVADFTGSIHVVDIGLELDAELATAQILDSADLLADYPQPAAEGHKYSRGVAGVLAGSEDYPGAGVLTTTSAVNVGVGMVRCLGSETVSDIVIGTHPEVVSATGRIDSLVMGPGNPEVEYVQSCIEALAETQIPVVLDASALDMVGRAEAMADTWMADRPIICTPHAGELSRLLSRLLGEIITSSRITADPAGWAAEAARLTGLIILLKGHRTVIAAPDGFTVLPEPGPASLATAGSGDVLAGILGALTAISSAQERHSWHDRQRSLREWAQMAGLGVLLHNAAGHHAINAGGLADALAEVARRLVLDAD